MGLLALTVSLVQLLARKSEVWRCEGTALGMTHASRLFASSIPGRAHIISLCAWGMMSGTGVTKGGEGSGRQSQVEKKSRKSKRNGCCRNHDARGQHGINVLIGLSFVAPPKSEIKDPTSCVPPSQHPSPPGESAFPSFHSCSSVFTLLQGLLPPQRAHPTLTPQHRRARSRGRDPAARRASSSPERVHTQQA